MKFENFWVPIEGFKLKRKLIKKKKKLKLI